MGTPKGLLRAPGEARSLVERLWEEVRSLDGEAVLVGEREEYRSLGLPMLRDAREETGPLGGLVALLREARRGGYAGAVALGCDFPYVDAELLERLTGAAPDSWIVAPFVDDRYQPLVARYSSALLERFSEALLAGNFALQPLLREFDAFRLPLGDGDGGRLVDWDTPEDIARSKESS